MLWPAKTDWVHRGNSGVVSSFNRPLSRMSLPLSFLQQENRIQQHLDKPQVHLGIPLLGINRSCHFTSEVPPPDPDYNFIAMGIIELPTCNTRSALPEPDMLDLDPALASEYTSLHPQIPKPLHLYLDAFSKQKAVTLLPRHPYDHSIDLKDGTSPLFRLIYSLSKVKQLALHNLTRT